MNEQANEREGVEAPAGYVSTPAARCGDLPPWQHPREALAEELSAVDPRDGPDGYAAHLLASSWLAAHDELVRADERKRLAGEVDGAWDEAEGRMNEQVWVIESGDYEQRIIFGVGATRDAAAAYVVRQYPEPYVVEWMPLAGDEERYTLRGHFEQVPGYSTRHVGQFDITPHELAGEQANGEEQATGAGDLRERIDMLANLAAEHMGCSGCPTPWWLVNWLTDEASARAVPGVRLTEEANREAGGADIARVTASINEMCWRRTQAEAGVWAHWANPARLRLTEEE